MNRERRERKRAHASKGERAAITARTISSRDRKALRGEEKNRLGPLSFGPRRTRMCIVGDQQNSLETFSRLAVIREKKGTKNPSLGSGLDSAVGLTRVSF